MLPEHHTCDQTQQGQQEGQEDIPLATGIMQGSAEDGLAGGDGILCCLLNLCRCIGIHNGDGLQLLALLPDGLVFLDLLLIAENEVVMTDVNQLGLILGIVVDGRIIGKQNLILL